MEPMTAMAIGGGLQAGASIIGANQAKKASEAALAEQQRQFDAMMARLDAIGIPSVEAQKIILTDPKLVGELIPEMREEAEQLASSMGEVEVDPRLKQAQMDALGSLQERADMGLTPEDKIALRQAREDIAGQLKSADANILQNMEQRGLGGSGVELAMRQAGGQSAMRQASEEADRLAAMQYNAKMQALQQAGAMSGQMRSQEFGEEAQKASALDAMAQFNLQNKMGVDAANVAAKNQAQVANLAQKQAIENARAANRSQEDVSNKALLQQKFQNEMAKASGQNAVSNQMASAAAQSGANQAANTMAMWGGIGSALGGAAQTYGDYQMANKTGKAKYGDSWGS